MQAQAELQAIQAENSQFGGGKRTIMDQARTIERLEYELAAVLVPIHLPVGLQRELVCCVVRAGRGTGRTE